MSDYIVDFSLRYRERHTLSSGRTVECGCSLPSKARFPVLAGADAPVVARHAEKLYPTPMREYRFWAGRFFSRVLNTRFPKGNGCETVAWAVPEDLERYCFWVSEKLSDCYSREEASARAETLFRSFLVVDGALWEVCGEPHYAIQPRCDESDRTSLYVSSSPKQGEESWLSALDPDAAVSACLAAAKAAGETLMPEDVQSFTRIEVLDRSVFRPNNHNLR